MVRIEWPFAMEMLTASGQSESEYRLGRGHYERVVQTHKPPLPKEELDTEFEKQYPPEPLGEELADNARVWKVYRDEATKADAAMLDGWNKTLDILLVFAGLFSAVVTSFVGQSNTQLQPDSNAYIANALFHLVTSNGSVNTLPAPPSLDAAPASTVVWVNALWFTSLLLSLAVAFLCILAKQWIGEYVFRTTSSSAEEHDWSRRRAFYFHGLNAWGLPIFLSLLPVLLHISLFFFIAGLCLSIWPLSKAIALCVSSIGSCLAGFYLIATIVPLWRPDCPTALPLTGQLRAALLVVLRTYTAVCILCFPAARKTFRMLRQFVLWPVYDAWVSKFRQACRGDVLITRDSSHHPTPFHLPLFDDESDVMTSSGEYRVPRGLLALQAALRSLNAKAFRDAQWSRANYASDANALRWLILDCSDHDAVAVGYQALGAVVHDSPLAGHIDIDRAIRNTISFERACTFASTTTAAGTSATEIMRILRSMLFIRPPVITCDWPVLDYIWIKPLLPVEYPDMALISRSGNLYYGGLREMVEEVASPFSECAPSPTIQSTLVLLFRIPSLPKSSFCELLFGASSQTWISNRGFITARLCGGDPKSPPCGLSHLPLWEGTCPDPLPCLAEALCAHMESTLKKERSGRSGRSGRRADFEKLMPPLVIRLLLLEDNDLLPNLLDMSHLMFCLGSDEFITCLDKDPSTVSLIAGLARSRYWLLTEVYSCNTAIVGLAKLCRHFASTAPKNDPLHPDLSYLINTIMDLTVFVTGNRQPHSELAVVSCARKRFGGSGLQFHESPIVGHPDRIHPPWTELLALIPWAPSHRLELFFFMTAVLCSEYSNAANHVGDIIREELDRSLVHLLRDVQGTAGEGEDLLCGSVRHYLQLCPTGWVPNIEELETGGVAYLAGGVTRDVLFLGPCVECSGHGNDQRWDRETEIYLIGLCQRLGVRFDVRYDADPDLQFLIELIALGAMVDAV